MTKDQAYQELDTFDMVTYLSYRPSKTTIQRAREFINSTTLEIYDIYPLDHGTIHIELLAPNDIIKLEIGEENYSCVTKGGILFDGTGSPPVFYTTHTPVRPESTSNQ